jgi:hypothetical protein
MTVDTTARSPLFDWTFSRAVGSPQLQEHDFNPGEENGLFWTVPLSEDSVDADFEDGTASLTLTRLEIDDYGNVGNALTGGHEIATASMNIRLRWHGPSRFVRFSQLTFPTPFAARELQGVGSGATRSWSAVENGHHFSGNTNTADFAMLATERNGVFFSGPSDE